MAISKQEKPYVGPLAFREGQKLYGRDRELLELLDLLIAERVVLLYSPSGAGKTSLIQAGLYPKLKEEGFHLLTDKPVRVSLQPPPGKRTPQLNNRYLASVFLSLESEERHASNDQITLAEYLHQLDGKSESRAIIFDQFEEILTLDVKDQEVKEEFFRQIGEMLRDRDLWALFSMREEFVAGLDPYLRYLPTRFKARFRLELLKKPEAMLSIRNPARDHGVDFTVGAAEKLTDDLRQVRVQLPDGTLESQLGSNIEPVQLQVVCLRLWEKLPPGATKIDVAEVEQLGNVDVALGDYYADKVASAVEASQGKTSERSIRDWFGKMLITESGVRSQVLRTPGQSGGLNNETIRFLQDAHLVRAEDRRGVTWYELSHDRLIAPVLTSNAAWDQTNLTLFQQRAEAWDKRGRPESLLLVDSEDLIEMERWASQSDVSATKTENDYLKESRRARKIKVYRNAAIWSSFALGALLLLILGFFSWRISQQNRIIADRNRSLQETNRSLEELRKFAENFRDNNFTSNVQPRSESEKVDQVVQSLKANEILSNEIAMMRNNPVDEPKNVVIEYFLKPGDLVRVRGELESLGFRIILRTPSESMKEYPTNSIFYGSNVKIEDIRLVAFALLRGGAPLRGISPNANPDKATVIQVGSDAELEDDNYKTLPVEKIKNWDPAKNKECRQYADQ